MNALPSQKPLMIYDGDCNFCRRWISRWKYSTGDRIEYAPFQQVADRFPEIPKEDFQAAVHLIEPDGRTSSGARAVFRALGAVPSKRWMLRVYEKVPGFAFVSEKFYRVVAKHRVAFSRLTNIFWGQYLERPSYHLSSWLFLRLMGIVYLIAFVSLGAQIDGLVGSQGILPAQEFLSAVAQQYGPERFHFLPTLFWIKISDGLLNWACIGGAILSVLLVLGFAQAPILFVLWALYLSLSIVCRNFLSFQWDILLLEAGFLSIFLAPGRILPGLSRDTDPSPTVLWLLRWLVFRVMFQSGCVKLLSGDATWWGLTALNFHYETQPLSNWIAWYVHQLPEWFQKTSVAVMFFIELAVPFLIFLPRRAKLMSFVLMVGFMSLIILTGNYCFFNLLAIFLMVLLLDDGYMGRPFPGWLRDRLVPVGEGPPSVPGTGTGETIRRWAGRSKNFLVAALAVCIVYLTGSLLIRMFMRRAPLPLLLQKPLEWVSPFRTVNSYGLFAVMTTSRPEIVIEGSNDGKTWLTYEFKWKPGDLGRRPAFVAPHQPRLDWQMWFAALGNVRNNPWFVNFMVRLLQGSEPVLELLEKNPFPESPPRVIRALVYDYHFTDPETKKSSGNWWRREQTGIYMPPISLR